MFKFRLNQFALILLGTTFLISTLQPMSEAKTVSRVLSTSQLKAKIKSYLTSYTVNDLIERGKAALLAKDPVSALIYLDFAILKDHSNQKAYFWRSIAIIANNPAILNELQARKILDSNYVLMPNAHFTLPDVRVG